MVPNTIREAALFLLLMWKNGTHGVGVPYAGPKKRAGKLPYDLKLRPPKERKKKMLSFGHAVAESYGSSSRTSRSTSSHNGSDKRSSNSARDREAEDDDATSPLKAKKMWLQRKVMYLEGSPRGRYSRRRR